MEPTTPPEFITLKEVAELLKASEGWIKRLVQGNRIPSYKVGGKRLFDKQEIIDWVKSGRAAGKE